MANGVLFCQLMMDRISPPIYFHPSDPAVCKFRVAGFPSPISRIFFHNNSSSNSHLSVFLFSPLLHLQWLFLFSALVHRGLRVDAARWRSALTHLLFPSLRVSAPSLRLPPLCSAVLKPNLHLKKKKERKGRDVKKQNN